MQANVSYCSFPAKNLCKNITFKKTESCYSTSLSCLDFSEICTTPFLIANGKVWRRKHEGGLDVKKASFPTTDLIFRTENWENTSQRQEKTPPY